jgi:peptide/nickel transport system substrate-binding protein
MAQTILPKHCLIQAVKEKKFSFTWGIDTPPAQIIGTGPFMLSEYHPGERLVFKRNPHYWKKSSQGEALPYLDKIIYLIIPDNQAQLLKFIDGELDSTGVSGSDYPLLKPLEAQKNFKIYEAGANYDSSFVTLNQNPGINPNTHKPFIDPVKLSWFTNLDFRRAIAHVIDKKKIIEILNNGFGLPQNGPMSPSSGFFYNPDVTVYDYNLDKARAILKQAGFKYRNSDQMLEDPQGHAVEFNLYTADAGIAGRVQMAAIIRSDLEKIGMKVNLVPVEFNTLVNKLMASFDWDMVMIGLTGGVEPHFGQNVWHSSGGLHLWNPHQAVPATDWEKRIDEIYDQGSQELDENKRKVLYDEFQRIVADQLPVIYTVLNMDMYAVRNKFGNLKPTVNGGAFHNIEEIYIKK